MKSLNLILSPHLDDAVLSLGGLLAREGADSIVATFFAGAPAISLRQPWDLKCGFSDSGHAIRERKEENQRALGRVGTPLAQICDYPYLDVEYRSVAAYAGPRRQELEAAIAKDIAALVEEWRATSRVKIFGPGLEMHTDHAIVKHAFLAYMRQRGRGEVAGFLYQDLPYADRLLEHRRSADFGSLDQELAKGLSNLTRLVIPLSETDMAKKLEAIEFYRSQIPALGGAELGKRIERFAASQAAVLQSSRRYCEVVYRLARGAARSGLERPRSESPLAFVPHCRSMNPAKRSCQVSLPSRL